MDSITLDSLHYEHVQWLSEMDFWQEEIKFLKKLCQTIDNGNGVPIADCINQLAHHERMLKSMKSQIISHENFLSDMLQEDGLPENGNVPDHDQNRDHMGHFHESFKQLKKNIYKISQPILI